MLRKPMNEVCCAKWHSDSGESGGIIDSVKFWTTKLDNCLDNQNGERNFYYMSRKFALAMLLISA